MIKRMLLLGVIACVATGGILLSKCTNPKHATKKDVMQTDGSLLKTNVYPCGIKASDTTTVVPDPFDPITRLCKSCGCHISSHDNEEAKLPALKPMTGV